MNIKIQGGSSGRYANKGSCTGVVTYLQHEDMDRAIEGLQVEPFFNNDYDRISSREVTYNIDSNKAQLGRNDAKFYVITVSPSQAEIKLMGDTPESRANAFRGYIKDDLMKAYADNFNKGLKQSDIKYYAKIHHDRGDKQGENMHAHIIVSRKDMSNKIKISPNTNHRNTKKGIVKGGFDRTNFFEKAESVFDKRFEYERNTLDSFKYQNAIKNGSVLDMKNQVKELVRRESQKEKTHNKNRIKTRGIEL